MKLFPILITLFFLAGCASSIPKQTVTRQITLHIVDRSEVARVAAEHGHPGKRYRGYAVWYADDTCEAWVVPPGDVWHDELWHVLLGHEMRHCFFGHFHD